MRPLWKYVFPGFLAVILPMTAAAQTTYDLTFSGTVRTVDHNLEAGIVLNGGDCEVADWIPLFPPDYYRVLNDKGANYYNLQRATIDIVDFHDFADGMSTTAVEIRDSVPSRFDLGNISLVTDAGVAAAGVLVTGTSHPESRLTFGAVTVTNQGDTALSPTTAGIWAQDDANNLTLTKNIFVKAKLGDAYGVRVDGDADIAIDGIVKIKATGGTTNVGIKADNLTLTAAHRTDQLTTNSTTVDGNLIVNGAGIADLGTLNMLGNSAVDVNNAATLAFDVARSNLGTGAKTVAEGAKIGVYTRDNTLANGSIIDLPTGGTITDWDKFNNWDINNTSGTAIFRGQATAAKMNDGFLAALGMHNRYAAWHAVRDHLISGNGYARGKYRGQEGRPKDLDVLAPICTDVCCISNNNRGAWINYIGRGDTYRSSRNGQNWKLVSEGVQAGTDLFNSRRTQFGLLLGSEKGKAHNVADRYNGTDRIKADDVYFGFYAARVLRCGADIRGSFAYGWQDYHMKRIDWDDLCYTSSFKGNTSETNIELGKRFAKGAWSLRPVIAFDVMTNDLKAGQETGAGNFAVSYAKTNLTQAFFRTGSELRLHARRFTLNSGLFYAYNMNHRGLETQITSDGVMNDAVTLPLYGTKLGREILMLNVGTSFNIARNLSVFGGYEGQYTLDGGSKSAMHTGYMGGGFRW